MPKFGCTWVVLEMLWLATLHIANVIRNLVADIRGGLFWGGFFALIADE